MICSELGIGILNDTYVHGFPLLCVAQHSGELRGKQEATVTTWAVFVGNLEAFCQCTHLLLSLHSSLSLLPFSTLYRVLTSLPCTCCSEFSHLVYLYCSCFVLVKAAVDNERTRRCCVAVVCVFSPVLAVLFLFFSSLTHLIWSLSSLLSV